MSIAVMLKWNFNANGESIAECVSMNEAHIVFLFENEFHSTAKSVVELKASLHSEEIVSSVRPGYRTCIQSQTGVAPTLYGFLVPRIRSTLI